MLDDHNSLEVNISESTKFHHLFTGITLENEISKIEITVESDGKTYSGFIEGLEKSKDSKGNLVVNLQGENRKIQMNLQYLVIHSLGSLAEIGFDFPYLIWNRTTIKILKSGKILENVLFS